MLTKSIAKCTMSPDAVSSSFVAHAYIPCSEIFRVICGLYYVLYIPAQVLDAASVYDHLRI